MHRRHRHRRRRCRVNLINFTVAIEGKLCSNYIASQHFQL